METTRKNKYLQIPSIYFVFVVNIREAWGRIDFFFFAASFPQNWLVLPILLSIYGLPLTRFNPSLRTKMSNSSRLSMAIDSTNIVFTLE